jgi:hypothetical protein
LRLRGDELKINYIRLAKIVAFIVFIGVVLTLTGKIVKAKFIGDSTSIVNGFYAEKKDDIDVLIMGSSNSFCTVDPIVLYDEYGIAAYDFGSSSQQMNMTYLYLKEALKKQSPKLVALEVNMLVGNSLDYENESALRWGLTDMPLSLDKVKTIYEATGGISADFFSYIFPIFRYHSRWNELSKTDYTYFYSDKANYTKGYLETLSVYEETVYLDGYMSEGEAYVDERNIAYLDKIIELCRKNNIELLLFKSPREGWYKYETDAVRQIADERNIQFIDYNELYYNGEFYIDVTNDFRDYEHLNNYGASKVTSSLGSYIKVVFDIPDRRGEVTANSWDKASEYRARSNYQEYMSATTAQECLEMLQDDENYVLIVTDSASGNVRQWVYEDCNVAMSKEWLENGIEHMNIGKTKLVLSKLGAVYQILIDGVEYYQAVGRWNIIVYDKIIGGVVADLNFDV